MRKPRPQSIKKNTSNDGPVGRPDKTNPNQERKMKDTKANSVLNTMARWFVGLVFLFSSFVKGVDPLGTTYKIEDYMTAWNIGSLTFEWALPMAGVLAMVLIVLEFTVGVMLLTNSFKRLTAWTLTLMMAFFTVTTFIDALTNKVSDCGCFGDAVILTNWQTFWKNVILDVPTAWILLTRNIGRKRRTERDTLIAIFAIVLMVVFGVWNIKNEPCIDFRAWKVGNLMVEEPAEGEEFEIKSYLTYKNVKTGEVKEFESKDFMNYYNQPGFQEDWEFVDSRVEDPNMIKADGFSMLDLYGEDRAMEFVSSDQYVMIATIHHIGEVTEEGANALKRVRQMMLDNGIEMVLLTSALDEEVQAFEYENGLSDMLYFMADETAIKAMMRSNPGFVLLKDSKVMGKWHFSKAQKIMNYDFEN